MLGHKCTPESGQNTTAVPDCKAQYQTDAWHRLSGSKQLVSHLALAGHQLATPACSELHRITKVRAYGTLDQRHGKG
jgi:hypothetical protein